MNDRDPRIDPRTGDVVRFGDSPSNRIYYEVVNYAPSLSHVLYWSSTADRANARPLAQWREIVYDAEVIHHAD
jgi:hypothetical protein